MSIKVAIDTSACGVEGAGMATYVREIVSALRRQVPPGSLIELQYQPRFSRRNKWGRVYDTLLREVVWFQTRLPRLLRQHQVQVFHATALWHSLRCAVPCVATIYDMTLLRHPELFRPWNRMSSSFYLRQAVRGADHLITISDFVKSDLQAHFPRVAPARVTAIPLGVNPIFHPVSEGEADRVRRKYQLAAPVVLSVCALRHGKNLERLVAAFHQLAAGVPHQLVLAGGDDGMAGALRQQVRDLRLEDRVRILGYVPLVDLPGLYRLADALAFVSLNEGFGLPPLEAMACRTPVLASNTNSIPEVVGAAGCLVDPLSVASIAAGLGRMLTDAAWRQQLAAAGLRRAREFSWDRCAQQTWAVYERVAAAARGGTARGAAG